MALWLSENSIQGKCQLVTSGGEPSRPVVFVFNPPRVHNVDNEIQRRTPSIQECLSRPFPCTRSMHLGLQEEYPVIGMHANLKCQGYNIQPFFAVLVRSVDFPKATEEV